MRSSRLVTRIVAGMAAIVAMAALAPAASAATDPAATFCRINIGTGAQTCHQSYDALLQATDEDDLELYAVVFNWINYNPGGGVSWLEGPSKCTTAYDDEPAKKWEHLDWYTYDNTPISLNNTISSYFLYDETSNCRMRLYDPVNLQAPYSSLLYADCPDLRTCSPGDWYDRAGSIAFT